MFFPAEDSEAELELLAVLRLTIQNKRRAFNKTKKVTATDTPTVDDHGKLHYYMIKKPNFDFLKTGQNNSVSDL